jgi:hypothetical protein
MMHPKNARIRAAGITTRGTNQPLLNPSIVAAQQDKSWRGTMVELHLSWSLLGGSNRLADARRKPRAGRFVRAGLVDDAVDFQA